MGLQFHVSFFMYEKIRFANGFESVEDLTDTKLPLVLKELYCHTAGVNHLLCR